MLKDDTRLFNQWKEPFSNDFEAVKAIAKKARQLANQVDNTINHSEALTWALTGNAPESLTEGKANAANRGLWFKRILQDELSLIDDPYVKMSVRQSLKQSIAEQEIRYVYINVIEEPKRAQIRIVTNTLWHKLHADN